MNENFIEEHSVNTRHSSKNWKHQLHNGSWKQTLKTAAYILQQTTSADTKKLQQPTIQTKKSPKQKLYRNQYN